MASNKGKVENQMLEKVLGYQEEVKAAVKSIADIEAAIEVQQAIITAADSFENKLPDLHTRREDLLAELITEGASREDLAALDEEIKIEKERLEKIASQAAQSVPDAKQAVIGLRRKLDAAVANFEALKDRKSGVLSSFLQTEAERLGAEYVQHATELIEKFRLLLAYSFLLRLVGGGSLQTHTTMHIPLFSGLAAHKGHDWPHQPGEMSEAIKSQAFPDLGRDLAMEEKTRISELGVEW